MACTRCGEDRPVDVVEWDLPPPCRACKRSSVVEDQIQVTAVTILSSYIKHPFIAA